MALSFVTVYAWIQKILSEGVQLWVQLWQCFCLVDEGREDPNAFKSYHWPASERPFKWWPYIECWLDSFEIFQGIRPILLRNPIFLWFFRGVRSPCPPLWIRACCLTVSLWVDIFSSISLPGSEVQSFSAFSAFLMTLYTCSSEIPFLNIDSKFEKSCNYTFLGRYHIYPQ